MAAGSMEFEDGALLEETLFSTDREMVVPIPFGMGDNGVILLCPICGTAFTNVDDVQMLTAAGRSLAMHAMGEDGESVCSAIPLDVKAETHRHEIVLLGSCERRHRFCIHFAQSKGVTETVVHRRADKKET